ncbi:MAG: sulfatase-like hydrolase/transferase [Planctomycetota bacterium JB042]
MTRAGGRVRAVVLVGLLLAGVAAVLAWRLTRGSNGLGVRTVVLVTLDTTRADRLGAYGGDPTLTPRLDRLAAEGVRFERCLTTAPITLPAHASILSGLDPIAHGARVNGAYAFDPANPSLAVAMQEAGFRTGAFVSAFPLDQRFGLDRGFDAYDDERHDAEGRPDADGLERRGEATVEAALDFVDEVGSTPLFLWVHLFDPHAPYEAPAPFSKERDDPYDAELAYTDHCVGQLLDGLAARERLADALVVVVGDHGEGLGEHGESTHTIFCYDSTLRVPWLIWAKDRLAPRRVPGTVSVSAVAPTVLDLLDLERPPGMTSRSWAAAAHGAGGGPRGGDATPAYFESKAPEFYYGFAPLSGIEADGAKLIVAPRPELYRPEDDPGELRNLIDDEPALAAALKKLHDDHVRRRSTSRGAAAALSERAEAQLRELGYVSAGGRGEGDGRDPKDGIRVVEALQEAALRSRDDVPGAIARLEALVRDEPEVAEALEVLGDLLAGAGRYEEARERYGRARELRPRNPELYVKEGQVLGDALGRADEAESRYRAALEIDPTHVRARVQLGLLFLRSERIPAAKRRFDDVLGRHPDVVAARIGRAECLLREGNVRLADQDLRHALGVDATHPHALWRVVETCVRLRNLEDALAFEERLRALGDERGWGTEVERELDEARVSRQ